MRLTRARTEKSCVNVRGVSRKMPRPSQRVRLETGLKLNLNRLVQRGFIKPGAIAGPVSIAWTDDTGQQVASATVTADMSGEQTGWLCIRLGRLNQCISLVARRRHFGGQQWFFICPQLRSLATVLWMPPGADTFASRQKWHRQVAYASQFMDPVARARLRSNRGFAHLAVSTLTNGIYRRNRSG